jgi:ATP-binding protein involved in chromosome partitioning
MSMGLISNEKMPVIWRGPMVSGAVMQLLSQSNWGELDYLIIDTPPGTGDVQLTLLQKIPLTGTVIVTTPQNVSVSDCRKGIEMINKLSIPILGLIENMSWFQPNDSEKKYFLFGEDGGKDLAAEYKIDLLAQLPLIEKENNKELHDLDQIRAPFEIVTDKIIELVKEVRSKKVDSIPQTNVTK